MVTAARLQFRDLASRLPQGFADAAWLWLVLRVGLGLLAALVVIAGAAPQPCNSDNVINGWKTFPPLSDHGVWFPLVGVWQHWDACWYSKIAAYGYETGVSSTTFFPLLPAYMAVVGVVTGGNVALAGILVNAIAFILALTGLRQLVTEDVDADVARRAVLYTAIFPAAFFFLAPFTESLFLAAAVWAILGARRRHWEVVLVAGLAAGFARPQGLLLVLPLGWEAIRAVRARLRARGDGRLRIADLAPLPIALGPALAYGAFVAFTALVVGKSYFEAHQDWASTVTNLPWDLAVSAVSYAISHHAPVVALNVGMLALFTLLTLAGIRRLPLSYTLYTVPQLWLTTTQQTVWPLMSTVRYLAVLFPCFVILAIAGRNERLHTAWSAVSILLLGYLSSLFVSGAMVG